MRASWSVALSIFVLLVALYSTTSYSIGSLIQPLLKRLQEIGVKMPPKHFNDGREVAIHEYVFAQDLDKLRGNPAAIMEVMDEYMSQHGHMMTFKPSKIKVAREILDKTRPKTVVELGTYVGFSALAWGKMIKEFHPDLSGCKVITMELNEAFAKISSDIVKLAGLDDVVQVVQGQSADSLQSLASYGIHSIDYLFIDHWEKYYLSDLKLCEELDLFHQGSVIIADNTDMPGAPDYVEYVKAGKGGKYLYSSTTYPTEGDRKHPNVLEVTMVG